ncbi:MAG: very short patch repair endonuclease [Sphingobacterium sp.]|nr:very short patch repair endonuclease [Sphingobacterium sp.]
MNFKKTAQELFGKPDFYFQKYNAVIFIDSCFWHACPLHLRLPATNTEYWQNKIEYNKKRDEKVNNYYKEIGWNLKRVWEHEIKDNLEKTVNEIEEFIEKAKL